MRQLGLALGNTQQATSLVLAIFLGGLAAGGRFGGQIADRSRRPVSLYGWLEIGAGAGAAIVSWAFSRVPDLLSGMTTATLPGPVGLALFGNFLAALLMLGPCLLMGATLPVLTGALVALDKRPAHNFTFLYGANLIGAATGAITCTFLGFPYLGIGGTILTVAVTNIAVGLAAVALSPPHSSAPVLASELDKTAVAGEHTWRKLPSWMVTIAALSGFSALAFEFLWTRLLRPFTSSSTYAFTIMVATFLLGLALGSFILNRWLAGKPRRPDEQIILLVHTQYGVAAASVAALWALPLVPACQSVASFVIGAVFLERSTALLVEALICAAFMLVPATLIGIAFPLIGALAASASDEPGRNVAAAYVANTAGCMAGSLAGSLVLVPLCGSQLSFEITIGLSLATALTAQWAAWTPGLFSTARVIAASTAVVAYAVFLIGTPSRLFEKISFQLAGGRALFNAEDATGTVAVVAYPGFKKLVVNGEAYSSTVLHGRRYMRLIGHLPVLLNPHPERVLSICFGTGTTSGASSLHPEVKTLDIVELSPAVLKAAPFFSEVNEQVLERPQTRVFVDDGRHYLLRTGRTYDVVTLEPPPPYDAGVVSLYSQEFYLMVRRHLASDGMLCQWVPLSLVSEPLWKMMIQAVRRAFPFVTIWAPNNREAIVLASPGPIRMDVGEVARRIDTNAEVKRSLTEVGLGDANAILATFLLSGQVLDRYLDISPPVTDDRAQLEFFLPYGAHLAYPCEIAKLGSYPADIIAGARRAARELTASEGFLEQRKAVELLWLTSMELARSGDVAQAREYLDEAASLVPDNAYLQYARTYPESQL